MRVALSLSLSSLRIDFNWICFVGVYFFSRERDELYVSVCVSIGSLSLLYLMMYVLCILSAR